MIGRGPISLRCPCRPWRRSWQVPGSLSTEDQMSHRTGILILAVLHLVVTDALTVAAFSLTMERFDTGESPTLTERVIEVSGRVLRFPVVSCALSIGLRLPGPTGYLPFILNSLLWANAVSWLFRIPWHGSGHRPTVPAGDI